MIYCVWYPSGGFGHFINAVLTLHGDNFARPQQSQVEFSATGTSHALDLVAPKYLKDPAEYKFDFDPALNYSVLIDNGIDSESRQFTQCFPTAKIYKLCYTDTSWPIVAKTLIVKAMNSNIEQEIIPGKDWNDAEPWALREKYFLFLCGHNFRHCWKPENDCYNLVIDGFFDYTLLKGQLSASGVRLGDFQDLHRGWLNANQEYVEPVMESLKIINAINHGTTYSLTHIKDLWTQAVVYYFIWIRFQREVPHNDYQGFFNNTDEIRTWLQL